MSLPADFESAANEAWERVRAAPGFLTEREARFLALIAAAAPGRGTILEIGSFKGKSTVGLVSDYARYFVGKVVPVDPFAQPSSNDPDPLGAAPSYADFPRTL